MPTRMTVKQWQTLPSSDKEVLKTLGILDLVKPLPNKNQVSTRILPKPYVLLRVFTCSLCGTIFEHYYRMLPFPDNPWALQAKEILFEGVLPTDTVKKEKEPCSSCLFCYRVLAKETKRELIKRIITLTK